MTTHAELIEQGIERRASIMGYIQAYHEQFGYPPSMAEIADAHGIAKNAVRHHLLRLQRDGKVSMAPGKYRSLRILDA